MRKKEEDQGAKLLRCALGILLGGLLALLGSLLIGVAAGWLWILLKKIHMNQTAALAATGFAGSMVNTITVMGSIYLLLAGQYAEAQNVAADGVLALIMGTVAVSGIPEAAAAVVLTALVGKVLIPCTSFLLQKR